MDRLANTQQNIVTFKPPLIVSRGFLVSTWGTEEVSLGKIIFLNRLIEKEIL